MQWLCKTYKSLDELPVVSNQAKKGLDFSVGLMQSEFRHSFQVILAGPDALLGYMMGQIVNLILEELTLTWLELQIMFSEALKHNVQVLQVFLLHFREDNHVIQVN